MTGVQAQRPLVFGEVLYDIFSDGSKVLGGAPFNVAWHLQAFGQRPLLISRLGEDRLGRSIRTAMQAWNMDTSGLQLDPNHPTGRVQVEIDQDEPSFSILPDQAYDYIDPMALPPLSNPQVLYHGSLAVRNPVSHRALNALKGEGRTVFLDVNLRPPWWNPQTVLELLGDARWIKLNESELDALAPTGKDAWSRASGLLAACDADTLFVTRGAKGAFALRRDGQPVSIEPSGTATFVDSVGAGDAFASVLLLGLTQGWDLPRILARAQEFASAIVGVRGATVREKAFYQPFVEAWTLT